MRADASPRTGDIYLSFDGYGDFVSIPSRAEYSVNNTGELTVSAWMKADVDDFPKHNDNYIHWIGKGKSYGEDGDQEWCFRMYNKSHPDWPQRTCFYVFNPRGGLGVGSHVPGPVEPGVWRHFTAVVANRCTSLFVNGKFVECDTFQGPQVDKCPIMKDRRTGKQVEIHPLGKEAALCLGTMNKSSYLQGGLTRVRVWGRSLSAAEIDELYVSDRVNRDHLYAEFLLNADRGLQAFNSAGDNHGTIHGATWAVQT